MHVKPLIMSTCNKLTSRFWIIGCLNGEKTFRSLKEINTLLPEDSRPTSELCATTEKEGYCYESDEQAEFPQPEKISTTREICPKKNQPPSHQPPGCTNDFLPIILRLGGIIFNKIKERNRSKSDELFPPNYNYKCGNR